MTDADEATDDGQARIEAAAPPRNSRAEMAVLGAMMSAPAVADEISEVLEASDFYDPKNGTIFGCITGLAGRGVAPDALAVSHALGDELGRIGGAAYLANCLEAPESVMAGGYYAGIVAELGQRRRVLEAGMTLQLIARQPSDVADVVERAQQAVHDATTGRKERALMTSVGDLIDPAIDRIEAVARGEVEPGIPTGLTDLDRVLSGGLKRGQLVIPAGRTAMGKSVFTQNILRHAAETTQRPVLLFSLEMSIEDMMNRLLSEISRVPLSMLLDGTYTDQDRRRIGEARDRLYGMPLYLVDSVRTTPGIRAYCRRFIQKHGDLAMVGVDYLQFVQPVAGKRRPDRHIEVGDFARDFKLMAQDMAMPVVAPCQLNRGPENATTSKDKNRPQLHHLRESGDLEQTADVVILLYRPGYYNRDDPRANEADIIVAKQRNGPADTVVVQSQLHIQRFADKPTGGRYGAPEPAPWE